MMREMLSAGLAIYHSMNQLPFVNLPAPGQEKVDQAGESIEAVQSAVNQLEFGDYCVSFWCKRSD